MLLNADWPVVFYGVGAIASLRAVFVALFQKITYFSSISVLTTTQWPTKTVRMITYLNYIIKLVYDLQNVRKVESMWIGGCWRASQLLLSLLDTSQLAVS